MLFHIAEKIIQTFDKQIEIVVNFVVGIVKDHNMLASLGSGIKWFFIIYIGIILISILYDNLEMAVMTNRTLKSIWTYGVMSARKAILTNPELPHFPSDYSKENNTIMLF